MQQQLDQSFTEQDLERLDHFLADDAPDSSMGLDELHGLLTAVICSPHVILPSQWIPVVWGDQEPEFANMDQAQDITGMMMRMNNDVASWLADGIFEPLFMEETLANGTVILDPHGWCEGFVRGMQLQPDSWRDEELNDALMPIIVLSDTIKDDPKIDELLDDEDAVEKLAEAIPGAVVSIFHHQRQHFQPPSQTVRRAPKVGRNDPCPCGSGKKYKKCCGASTLH